LFRTFLIYIPNTAQGKIFSIKPSRGLILRNRLTLLS